MRSASEPRQQRQGFHRGAASKPLSWRLRYRTLGDTHAIRDTAGGPTLAAGRSRPKRVPKQRRKLAGVAEVALGAARIGSTQKARGAGGR